MTPQNELDASPVDIIPPAFSVKYFQPLLQVMHAREQRHPLPEGDEPWIRALHPNRYFFKYWLAVIPEAKWDAYRTHVFKPEYVTLCDGLLMLRELRDVHARAIVCWTRRKRLDPVHTPFRYDPLRDWAPAYDQDRSPIHPSGHR